MKTPVLIPARNESECLVSTIEGLPKAVEPIVILNGCTDNGLTRFVAKGLEETAGITVLDDAEEGKMAAIQHGLRYLGERALEPFISLDADTMPIFRNQWEASMLRGLRNLDPGKPYMGVGATVYLGRGALTSSVQNVNYYKKLIRHRNDTSVNISGRNVILRLPTGEVLNHVLGLENFWPGDDNAIKDSVLSFDGLVQNLLHPFIFAKTHSERYPEWKKYIRDRNGVKDVLYTSYLKDAPEQSKPYRVWGQDLRES